MNISLPADLIPDKVQRGKFELLRKHNRVIEFLNANRFYFISTPFLVQRITRKNTLVVSSNLILPIVTRLLGIITFFNSQIVHFALKYYRRLDNKIITIPLF